MPKEPSTHAVPRQRPVSCKLCRTRKLRCSREAPCSNCVARGVQCELEPHALPTRAPEPDLLERIRKLEQIVEHQQTQLISTRNVNAENQQTTPNSFRCSSVAQQTPALSPDAPTSAEPIHSSSFLPETGHLDNDVAWLESIYNGRDFSHDKIPTNRVVFRSCPIQQVPTAQPYVVQNAFEFPTRCIWLPQYAEAKVLVEKYLQDIDHVHHVIHTPSIMFVLDEVYACLSQQGQVKPGNIILLLAIFASCTHSWVQSDSARRCLFDTPSAANNQSTLWIKALEDVLDIAYRTTKVSVEGIQGIVLIFFIMVNIEGFSRRVRAMFNTAHLLARELGLHCIDHPSYTSSANTLEAEIGRRVWWYLVASDWLGVAREIVFPNSQNFLTIPRHLLTLTLPLILGLVFMVSGIPRAAGLTSDPRGSRAFASRFDNMAQGVYQCHPRQMATKRPLHLNDEDLKDGMSRVEKPLDQPTSMSYSLLRIRLAEISRTIVDRTPLMVGQEGGHMGGPSYDVVMDVDTQLQLLINDHVPRFFSMSIADLIKTYNLEAMQAAHIAQQGYMFYSLLYAQRCKLHFPFYRLGFTDLNYAASRDLCLRSARLIIQTESKPDYEHLRYAIRYKFIGLIMSVFMASLVLLMDLCHNKSSAHQDQQRSEITAAIRILKDARHESDVAAKFLDCLMLVLRKHKVSPQPSGASSNGPNVQPYVEPAATSVPSSTSVMGNEAILDEDLSMYFDELAQNEAGSYDWDSIFSGLNSGSML